MHILSAVLVIFGIHNFNEYGPKVGFDRRTRFSPVAYERFRIAMLVISSFSILIGLALGCYFSIINAESWMFPLTILVTSIGGIVYSWQLVPDRFIQKFGFRSIRDLPGAKDISISFGWALLFTILPLSLVSFSAGISEISLLVFLFLSVFRRSAIMGVRDVQGDRIVGMESTFKFLGKARAKILLLAIDFFSFVSIAVFILQTPVRNAFMIPIVICFIMGILFSLIYRIRRLPQEVEGQFLMDSQFVLPGILGVILVMNDLHLF
jgi:4-hydroxy-3-methylbut-2-enyl diphosphate reductase